MNYELTMDPANNEDIPVCPSLPPGSDPGCFCQIGLSEFSSMNLSLCAQPKRCCASCTCWGDPHCKAFNSNTTQVLSLCDSRNSDCKQQKSICRTKSWDGQQCVWNKANPSFCSPAPGTKPPIVDMYTKTYRYQGGTRDFSVELGLGLYGIILQILVKDGDIEAVYRFKATSPGQISQCLSEGDYPLNNKNEVLITGLPSGVDVFIRCIPGRFWNRYMELIITDPFYGTPEVISSDGYCPTGEFADGVTGNPTLCNGVNFNLQQLYGCKDTAECRVKFCRANWSKLSIAGAPPSYDSCIAYVTAAPFNFLTAACSTSPRVIHNEPTYDPTLCFQDFACNFCVQDAIDNPVDLPGLIGNPAQCTNSQLIQTGLRLAENGGIPYALTGVNVEYQDPITKEWSPVFSLLEETILFCLCPIIQIDGLTVPQLFQVGKYRIRQCGGIESTPPVPIDRCQGISAMQVAVKTSTPGGGARSIPLGQLWEEDKMRCSNAMFPQCPEDYQCCVWNTKPEWKLCMEKYHPNANPGCKFSLW